VLTAFDLWYEVLEQNVYSIEDNLVSSQFPSNVQMLRCSKVIAQMQDNFLLLTFVSS
jgi:hypothetical protein